MNNRYNVKRILWIIFDTVLIATGVIITPFGFLGWREAGFTLESLSAGNTLEGSSTFFTAILGIVLVLYGLFDLLVLRRLSKEKGEL